ncbi:MAG: alpha/beta fold hydrolase [Myxococcales bacterium]|nr:alpha/beta fold hydrolase [Myxococcales bacterium]
MSFARLHVEVQGPASGPPVIFLHGLAGSARNWRPQLRALRESHLAIAFDLRGHARSEAPEDGSAYDAATFVEDALSVLTEHVGPATPAVWVGLSMGAVIALEAAFTRPERVRGLVLASYPGGHSRASIERAAHTFADAIEREGLEAAGERFVWGPESGVRERDAAWVRQGFLEHPPHGLAHCLRGVLAPREPLESRRNELAALDAPVQLIAGGRDAPSVDASQVLAELVSGARLDVVPDAGHVVNLVGPKAFNALLLGFLARLE